MRDGSKNNVKLLHQLSYQKMNQTLVNQQQLFQEIVQDIEQNRIAIAAKKLRQQEADAVKFWLSGSGKQQRL